MHACTQTHIHVPVCPDIGDDEDLDDNFGDPDFPPELHPDSDIPGPHIPGYPTLLH